MFFQTIKNIKNTHGFKDSYKSGKNIIVSDFNNLRFYPLTLSFPSLSIIISVVIICICK